MSNGGTATIPSFLGHKAVSRSFCIVQKIERYFGTGPYTSKRLNFDRFKAVFRTIKRISEIKVRNMKIELSFVVQLSSI